MNTLLTTLTAVFAGIGRAQFFLINVLAALPAALTRPRILAQQVHSVGVMSLIIVVLSGSFVGMVLALQGFRTLVRFGAEESLGVFVALVIVRELGPVVTALLVAGRAGSALAAGSGLLKGSVQLSAMEMIATGPLTRVIAPRFLAMLISMPLLSAIFSVMAIGIAGGHAVGVSLLGVDDGSYWGQIRASVEVQDIVDSLIKSTLFGFAVAWIAVYQGYHAAPTSEGVSRATTSTVVLSSLAILALDFVLTAFMFR
mgnify:FL=1